jgi:hypothetical protein
VPPYQERFPKGSAVRIADRRVLDDFVREWRFHHPLSAGQLEFADRVAVVKSVGFYHGGDVLYELDGVPGTWHERCLSLP